MIKKFDKIKILKDKIIKILGIKKQNFKLLGNENTQPLLYITVILKTCHLPKTWRDSLTYNFINIHTILFFFKKKFLFRLGSASRNKNINI